MSLFHSHRHPLFTLTIHVFLAIMKTLSFVFVSVAGFFATAGSVPVTGPATSTIALMERSPFDNLNWPQYLEVHKRHLSSDRFPSFVLGENGARLERRQNRAGTIGLDVTYTGPIIIGQQNFNVSFDTESAMLFVPSVKCKSFACQTQSKFDETKSKTFTSLNDHYTKEYGAGSVDMDIGADDVTIAGFTAKSTSFGVATKEFDGKKVRIPGDGIFGMALDKQAYKHRPTPFSTLVKQGSLKDPVVGMYLSNGDDSSLTVGGVDKTKFTGSLKFTKIIDSTGHWFVPLGGISVNGQLANIKPIDNSLPLGALIQSSSLAIYGPSKHVAIIYKSIAGAKEIDEAKGIYGVPCDTKDTLAFKLNDQEFELQPSDWVMKPIDNTKLCQGGIVGYSNIKYWVMGTVFMKTTYTAFNFKTQELGLAHSVRS